MGRRAVWIGSTVVAVLVGSAAATMLTLSWHERVPLPWRAAVGPAETMVIQPVAITVASAERYEDVELREALEQPDLGGILKLTTWRMADSSSDPRHSIRVLPAPIGERLLYEWSKEGLTWQDVQPSATKPVTVEKVLEDPRNVRGEKLCTRGEIFLLDEKAAFRGALVDGDGISFLLRVVGSVGDLKSASQARFCGLFTEMWGTSIKLVGMFDLPENRARRGLATPP